MELWCLALLGVLTTALCAELTQVGFPLSVIRRRFLFALLRRVFEFLSLYVHRKE